MNTTRHREPLWVALQVLLPAGGFVLAGLVFVALGVADATGLLSLQENVASCVEGDLLIVALGIAMLCVAALASAMHTDIIAGPEGLRVKVWLLRWVLIPWRDVRGLASVPVSWYPIDIGWLLLRVRRLTIGHRLVGIGCGLGGDPVLVLRPQLGGRDELLRRIESAINSAEPHHPRRGPTRACS